MLVYCKHNISWPHYKSCVSWILLDVCEVETLLSLQIHMIPMASDRVINICDCEPPSLWARESEVIKAAAAPSTADGTLTLWTFPKDIWAFPPKPSSILKAEITVRNQKMHAHTVKVTFPISANYSKFSEVQYCSSARHHTSAGETNSSAARQLLCAQDYKLNCLRQYNISER